MRVSKRASTRARGHERTFFFAIAAAVLDVGPIVPFAARAGSPRASRVPIDDGPTFFAQRAWPRAPGMGGSEKRTPSPGNAFVTPRSVRCQCLRAPLAPSPLGLCAVVLVGAVASAGTRRPSRKPNENAGEVHFLSVKYLQRSFHCFRFFLTKSNVQTRDSFLEKGFRSFLRLRGDGHAFSFSVSCRPSQAAALGSRREKQQRRDASRHSSPAPGGAGVTRDGWARPSRGARVG